MIAAAQSTSDEKCGLAGMGEVYLAQDTGPLDRKVALKFLPQEMQQDEAAKQRFLREAKSAAALDHPYVCHIHEVGEADGRDFIAMEYLQGITLEDRLAKGPLPLEEGPRRGQADPRLEIPGVGACCAHSLA